MKILYSKLAYDKIMYWVGKCNVEISGFGTVEYLPDTKTFYVTDAYLIKQEGRAATTDIDGAALSKLMYEKRGEAGNCKLWWHSHVNMAAFWSGTDTATIRELGSQGWITASVFNKKEEVRSAYCCKVTSELATDTQLYDDIKTEVETELDEELIKLCEEEYASKFTEYKYVAPVTYPTGQYWNERTDKKSKKNKKKDTLLTGPADDSNEAYSYIMKQEASLLGMTAREYEALIDRANYGELSDIQARLDKAYDQSSNHIRY